MDKLGITFEELVEIYDRNGHVIKQPNSVKAIAGALNVVASRVYNALDERLTILATAVMDLSVKVGTMSANAQRMTPQRASMRGECYCGTPISGPRCEVCKKIFANHA
jgi:hypothetical protein